MNFFLKTSILIIFFNILHLKAINRAVCTFPNQNLYINSHIFYCCKYRLKSEGGSSFYYYAFFGRDLVHEDGTPYDLHKICNPDLQPIVTGVRAKSCTKYDKLFEVFLDTKSVKSYNSPQQFCATGGGNLQYEDDQ